MSTYYSPIHNRFRESLALFTDTDPDLMPLSELPYPYQFDWWKQLSLDTPGIYILTGGRQIGKSTSCKQLIEYCLQNKSFLPNQILYITCDEIFTPKALSETIRAFLDENSESHFLLIIDEITYVDNWDRVIKALADEGHFTRGLCLLTGSDTIILKEAAARFPGRRGIADQTDFHIYPLSFSEYVKLISDNNQLTLKELADQFQQYLQCGGYLRAINDYAMNGEVSRATFATYEQWLRGDFIKRNKSEETVLAILNNLITVGVSPISYSALTQKIGLISKQTCIDYLNLLERMDILFNLQAFDQNKKQGFPRKARKFHFIDPFIYRMVTEWLIREGHLSVPKDPSEVVEACVASHCHRLGHTYYFKSDGEIDVVRVLKNSVQMIEVKWSRQIRLVDLKMLKHHKNSIILIKSAQQGVIDNIQSEPVYSYLNTITSE